MSRPQAGHPGVNLMPLLDVLLCTMGTLIIVLGIIYREARLHPAKRTPGAVSASTQELVDAKDDLEFRVDGLAAARDKCRAELEDKRAKLADVEDHWRRMEDQLLALRDAAKQLHESPSAGDSQRDRLRGELAQLNARRQQLDGELKRARYQAVNRQPVYAVVPFEGLYKTSRRPIYIECRGDCVILQPEGIVFTPSDFLGPGGPGNPLASALRAAQEYWRQAPRPSPGMPNEPYPLLLVRPDGIIAYYLVRDAMSSWDAEFGYELVGQDWQLDYPMKPEPQLKDMETRAVAESRERMQWLAQVSPELFERKPSKVQYHVSPFRGGAVRDGGPSLGNDPFADDPLGGFGRQGSGFGVQGSGPGGSALRGGPESGPGVGSQSSAVNGLAGTRGNSAFGLGDGGTNGGFANGAGNPPGLGGPGGAAAGGTSGMMGGDVSGPTGSAFGGSGGLAGGTNPATAGTGSGSAGTSQLAMGGSNSAAGGATSSAQGKGNGAELSPNEYGYVALPGGAGGDGRGATGSGGSMNGQSSLAGSSGSYAGGNTSTAAGMSSSGGGDSSSSGGSASQLGAASGQTNPMASGMPSVSFDMAQQQSPQQYDPRLDQQQSQSSQRSSSRGTTQVRGHNWALPNMHNASMGVQRPIRVECYADRLILLPDTHDQEAQTIPLGERTDDAVDQLVAAVRTYTKSWGMAGRGMYWKPQLVLNVNPNADSRAADLQAILADSGWDVKRR
jgi:hypothetical protein